MSGTAPYEVNVIGSDDETFQFTVPFENADGTAFPFADYAIEYAVMHCGSPVLSLSQGNGITIAAPDVTFDGGLSSLKASEYEHGCRIRNLLTGKVFQVFDGSVTIGEGSFR